jgi:hypothetical protein
MPGPSDASGEIPGIAAVLERLLRGLKATSPETRSLEIRCPDEVARVSIFVKATYGVRKLNPDLVFPSKGIRRAELRTLTSFRDRSDLITLQADGYHLNIAQLDHGEEGALLNIDYDLPSRRAIDSIVSTYSRADTVGTDDQDVYWMEAAIRNPGALSRMYGTVDLRDLEVSVNVGIYERVLAAIPQSLIRRFDTLRSAISEPERGRRMRALLRYNAQRTSGTGPDDFSQFSALRAAFQSTTFHNFVDVEKPFDYAGASPGEIGRGASDLFELPKFVDVESRVDLNLLPGKQAAKSRLFYKVAVLRSHLETLTGGGRGWEVALEDLPPDLRVEDSDAGDRSPHPKPVNK